MFRLKIERRTETPAALTVLILGLSLIMGLGAVSCVFLLKGANPVFALQKIFVGSFGSIFGIKETITKAIPLILIGSGLALAFRAGFWNIGAEGQLLCGAIFATYIGLHLGAKLPPLIIISLMFLAGFIGGGLCGCLAVFLKCKFHINEVISTLMLNYIIAEVVQYLIYGPWKGSTHLGFPYTDNLPLAATLPLIYASRIHYPTLILAIISPLIIYILLMKTKLGYEVRVIGENPEAARYAGINTFKVLTVIMLVSGGLAGMAGVGEVAGIHHHLTYPWSISAGYGYTAIIVACLARYNPQFIIISALFFAGILVGGDAIQTSLGLPFATVHIFNGLLLFSIITGVFFLEHRIKFTKPALVKH